MEPRVRKLEQQVLELMKRIKFLEDYNRVQKNTKGVVPFVTGNYTTTGTTPDGNIPMTIGGQRFQVMVNKV